MKQKFKITGYQVVHADNRRDNVSMLRPAFVEDIEEYRKLLTGRYKGCKSINLSIVDMTEEEER